MAFFLKAHLIGSRVKIISVGEGGHVSFPLYFNEVTAPSQFLQALFSQASPTIVICSKKLGDSTTLNFERNGHCLARLASNAPASGSSAVLTAKYFTLRVLCHRCQPTLPETSLCTKRLQIGPLGQSVDDKAHSA